MKPESFIRFFQELKRRRVFRGIVVYGASTLILLEAAQNLCNAFGVEYVPTWFIWLLGVGFLGSLWFSWIYDITPGGIVKTEPITGEKVAIPSQKLRAYKATTFLSLIIIVGLLTFRIIDDVNTKKINSIEKSIAVLPLFDNNLSPSKVRHFEFIGHQITSCLLKVKDYRILPWEDTRKYSRIGKSYVEIGQDLDAALLVDWKPLETSIEKHLYVDLVSVDDKSLLWSDNYIINDDWTGAEICRCSRKISKKITKKLRTYLTPEERDLISEEPRSARASMLASIGEAMTQDTWEMIHTGKELIDTVNNEYIDSISFERAISYFTEAIKEDPTLAEAYANRAKAKLWGIDAKYFNISELAECEKDIKNAFALKPDLPEAHIAMGFYYYYGLGEYELALISFKKAFDLRPNDNEYIFYLSIIWRTLGNWKEVKTLTDKLFYSNPRNALFLTNLGISYQYMHDFSRCIVCQDRAIALNPKWYAPYINKIEALVSTGDVTQARVVLKKAEEKTGKNYYRMVAEFDLYEGRYFSAIENIERAKPTEFSDLEETEGDAYLLKAKIYKHAGQMRQAKEHYKSAVDYYNNLIKFNPEDYFSYGKLGIAYAGIGLNQRAIETGQKALELIKQQKNRKIIPLIMYDMIQIYAITGEQNAAQNMINELMNSKSPFTPEFINLDPDIKQLLNKPTFINL